MPNIESANNENVPAVEREEVVNTTGASLNDLQQDMESTEAAMQAAEGGVLLEGFEGNKNIVIMALEAVDEIYNREGGDVAAPLRHEILGRLDELLDDTDVALCVVKDHGDWSIDIENFSERVRNDAVVMKEAIRSYQGNFERRTGPQLLQDDAFIKDLIDSGLSIGGFLPETSTLRDNDQFLMNAFEIDPELIIRVSDRLKRDSDFIKAALLRTPKVEYYIDINIVGVQEG